MQALWFFNRFFAVKYRSYLNDLSMGIDDGFFHLLHMVHDLVELHQLSRQLLNLQSTNVRNELSFNCDAASFVNSV